MPGVRTSPLVRWVRVTVDCDDAEVLAAFYARILGWEVHATDGAGWVQLRDPSGGVGLNLQSEPWYERPQWPEVAGSPTKMMHLELLVDDLEGAVELAVEAGGTEASPQPLDRDPRRMRVMLDPAGHPFCLFVAGE